MKIAMFSVSKDEEKKLGVVIGDNVVSIKSLAKRFDRAQEAPADMTEYLEKHPQSETLVRDLVKSTESAPDALDNVEKCRLENAFFGPSVPKPAALFDFGLSPRHLKNSALTLIRREKKWPVANILSRIVRRRFGDLKQKPSFHYYKGNHHSIIGDMDLAHWPSLTSYLDIEPELAVVTGPVEMGAAGEALEQSIAGYTIFNDFSARDVQWPEMISLLGPMRCKDFERGNALGPFLVTPDEVQNPLALNVNVTIGDRYSWKGTTAEYNAHPMDAAAHLASFRSLPAGTVIGLGTVPDCCGLDHDQWLHPGDHVTITFDQLGTLHQPIPQNIGPLETSRWTPRSFS